MVYSIKRHSTDKPYWADAQQTLIMSYYVHFHMAKVSKKSLDPLIGNSGTADKREAILEFVSC